MLEMEMVPRFGTIMYYRPIPRLQTNKKKKKKKKRKRKKRSYQCCNSHQYGVSKND